LRNAPPSRPVESLSGLIERVTFHNDENGFAVFKVKAKGHRDLVTVIGSLASVSAGEWVTAEGRWVQDREFGLQFKADMLNSTAPTTREGIEKYLGSGMVKGIGPVYAKKLVEKFGEKIFDIIDQESARLEDVDGIGPKHRTQIKDAWAEQKVIRKIMVWRQPGDEVPLRGRLGGWPVRRPTFRSTDVAEPHRDIILAMSCFSRNGDVCTAASSVALRTCPCAATRIPKT
jgi:hypothetical protein